MHSVVAMATQAIWWLSTSVGSAGRPLIIKVAALSEIQALLKNPNRRNECWKSDGGIQARSDKEDETAKKPSR